MFTRMIRSAPWAAVALTAAGLFVGSQVIAATVNVAYFTDNNSGSTDPAAVISGVGYTPIQFTSATALATQLTLNPTSIQIVMINEADPNTPTGDLIGSLPA